MTWVYGFLFVADSAVGRLGNPLAAERVAPEDAHARVRLRPRTRVELRGNNDTRPAMCEEEVEEEDEPEEGAQLPDDEEINYREEHYRFMANNALADLPQETLDAIRDMWAPLTPGEDLSRLGHSCELWGT